MNPDVEDVSDFEAPITNTDWMSPKDRLIEMASAAMIQSLDAYAMNRIRQAAIGEYNGPLVEAIYRPEVAPITMGIFAPSELLREYCRADALIAYH